MLGRPRHAPAWAAVVAAAAVALLPLPSAAASGGGGGGGAAAPKNGIDFRSTFDDGTIKPWKEVQRELDRPLSDSFRIVDSPTRYGRGQAAMFIARHGYSDFGYNEDSELCCGASPEPTEGSDYWYAWSTLFAEPWYGPYRWGIFAQWHSDFGIPPPVAFDVGVSAISVQLHTGAVTLGADASWEFDHTYRLLNDVSPGRWHDFIVHIHWSAYHKGSVTVWHRLAGEPRFERLLRVRNVPTLQRLGAEVSPVYTLLGIYRGSYCGEPTTLGCQSPLGVQPDTVVVHDDYRRSTTIFPGCTVCRKG